jgi:transcriptional regulator with XRE-family HTH domain
MPTRSKEKNILQTSFGHVVRTLRYKLNLTQDELAERAGLNRAYIGDLELGGRNLSLRNILRLSVALEVTPEKFMGLFAKQLKQEKKDFDLKDYLEKSKWVERG